MKKLLALIACLTILAGCGRCCNPCDPCDPCPEEECCREEYCEECRMYHAPEPE